jgi:hypothetical protein
MLDKKNKEKTDFEISIVVRDPLGRPLTRKSFGSNSGDSLSDWYTRNTSNEFDNPMAARKHKKKKKNNPKKSQKNQSKSKG